MSCGTLVAKELPSKPAHMTMRPMTCAQRRHDGSLAAKMNQMGRLRYINPCERNGQQKMVYLGSFPCVHTVAVVLMVAMLRSPAKGS